MIARTTVALTLILSALTATAAEKPLWEVGAGGTALSFPAYRGSDETRQFLMPIPYFVYRGEFLKADRQGMRASFLDTERLALNLGLALSPPASSKDIAVRTGMPDLKASFEVGPQFEYTLWHTPTNARSLKLIVPVRAAYTVERKVRHIGWVWHPKLNLDLTDLPALPGWNLGLQAGVLYGDQRQHAHTYTVAPEFATAARPAYSARGGYAGTQFLVGVSKRFANTWLGAFVRYDNLSGAVFADSPLVRSKNYVAAGIALSWVLGESTTRVTVND